MSDVNCIHCVAEAEKIFSVIPRFVETQKKSVVRKTEHVTHITQLFYVKETFLMISYIQMGFLSSG